MRVVIENHHHYHFHSELFEREVRKQFQIVNSKLDNIMGNEQQALQDLADIKSGLAKVKEETTTLVQKVTDLEAAANANNVPQSVLDAIAEVKASVTAIDDMVPDAPVTDAGSGSENQA